MFLEVKPRVRKPAFGSVVVDWSHPLANGLVGEYLFNEEGGGPQNLVTYARAILRSATTWSSWGKDTALNFTTSVNDGVQTTSVAPFPAFTWIASFAMHTTSQPHSLVTTAGSNYNLMDFDAARNVYMFTSDGLAANTLGINGLSADTPYEFAYVREGDSVTNGYKGYLNGVFKGQANTGIWSPSAGQTLWFGNRSDVTTQAWDGKIGRISIYNRALSAKDIASYYAEPYAFLKPKLDPFFSFPFGRVVGGGPQLIAVGQVTETDLAQSIAQTKLKAIGQLTETDLAQPISHTTGHALGQATETDAVFALTRLKSRVLGVGGLALETDLSQSVAKVKKQTVGQAVEFDAALKVTAVGGFGGGGAGPGRGSGLLRTIRG